MNWPNPGYIIAAIAAATIVYKIFKWISNREAFEGTTNKAIERIDKAIAVIREDIKRILGHVGRPAIKEGSPLRLTDLGEEIAQDIAARAWAAQQGKILSAQVADRAPYDIQRFCFDLVRGDQFDPGPDLLEKMKASAYNRATTFEQVENVLAIALRDVLLEIHDLKPPETDPTP